MLATEQYEGLRSRMLVGAAAAVALFAFAVAVPPRAAALDVELAGGAIVLTDRTGVNNRVGITKTTDGLRLLVSDRAGGFPATPPAGCTGGTGYVECPLAGISRIVASLGAGKDTFGPVSYGSHLPQEVNGGPGNDTFEGGPADDEFRGGTGNDSMRGESGRDQLFGQGGNDRLAGGRDADRLNCGKGKHDKGVGGPAEDTISGCEDEQS